jgi:hypothetical protein
LALFDLSFIAPGQGQLEAGEVDDVAQDRGLQLPAAEVNLAQAMPAQQAFGPPGGLFRGGHEKGGGAALKIEDENEEDGSWRVL